MILCKSVKVCWVAAFVAALVLGIFTQAATAGQAASPKVSGQINVMTWSAGPSQDKTSKDLVKLFQRTHSGTTVNLTILPFDQYAHKLTLLIATGKAPDVFAAPGDALRYVREGTVIPLDSYYRHDPILGNPNKSRTFANKLTMYDRKHVYAAQFGALCSMQLYYNRDLFRAAHVSYPTNKWTWNDFLKAAKKLTVRQGGKIVQWGTDLGYLQGWDGGWQTMAASNGAKKIMDSAFDPHRFRLNQPAVVKSWQFMQDLIYKYEVAPNPATSTALSQGGTTPFQTGKVAMVPDGCCVLSNYKTAKFKVGMSLLPRGTTSQRIDPIWAANAGIPFFIAKSSNNKDLAWEWLRWMAADRKANQAQAASGENCGAPIVKAYDRLFAKGWNSIPGGNACVRSLDRTQYFQISALNWQKITDTIITPAWDKFVHNKITAKEMAKTIEPQINDALKSGS